MVMFEVLATHAEMPLPTPASFDAKFRISKPSIVMFETPLARKKALPGWSSPSMTGALDPVPGPPVPGSPTKVTD